MIKGKDSLITLVEIAFSAADAKEKYGMKIGDHKLICSILDFHTDSINRDRKEKDEAFHKSLIADVVEVIGNELKPIQASLKNIEAEVIHLRADVTGIKQQVKAMGEDNERVHQQLKEQIEKLDERTKESKVWTIRVVFAIISIVTAIGAFIWIHNHYLLEFPPLSLWL
jgi:hypothetical protein